MSSLGSRQGIGKLETSARAHGYFLLRARIRWRRVCRIGALHGRSRLRACVYWARWAARCWKRARRGAATSRRGALSDVDVAAAEFAGISGENKREYTETHGLDARGGGGCARGALPIVVGRRGKL